MSQKKIKKLKENIAEAKVKNDSFLIGSHSVIGILKRDWLFLFLLIAGTIGIYINSLRGDFVSDDYASITQNPDIANFFTMFKTLSLPAICNSFIASLFGIVNTVPYHLFSLLLYIIICVLLYIFLVMILGKVVARYSILLYAFHPIHVEAVSWISGRPYLLTTLFVMISIISLLKLAAKYRNIYLGGLLVGFTGMMMTDRIRGFALFLIIGLILISFKNITRIEFKVKKYLPWMLLIAVIVIVVTIPWARTRIETVNSGYNTSESIFYNPFFQYPTAITKYLQLLLIPTDLTLYHTMYVLPVWLNWLVIGLYLSSVIYFYFKNKNIFFCLVLIFVASSPSMLPVKVSWLVAERYVFFGSIGLCALFGIIFYKMEKFNRYIPIVMLAVILVLFGYRTYLRNNDWQTNHNLWVNTCQVSPNSHNAWNNIGDDYDKLKDYPNAIKGFTQSTVVKPNYADAYHNRANIFFKMGRLDLARDSYMIALQYSPALYHSYLSLTQIDLMEKNFELALQHAQAIVNLQPNNPQSWYVAGVVFSSVGDKEKAKSAFNNSLSLAPDYQLARDALLSLQ